MAGARDNQLAFTLFCLVTATMILRPGEMLPGLAGVPIYEGLILSTAALAHRRLLSLFSPATLKCQPIALCFVGVLFAIPISQLTHMYFGGAVDGLVEYLKAGLFFALLIAVVDRWERFERLLFVIATCATITVSLCVVDYYDIIDLPFITHVTESHGVDLTGADQRIARMNGTGIFSDPNDISLLIIATGIIAVSFVLDRERGQARFLWLLPLVVLAIGLISTKSRGGMLAACGAGGVLLMFRYGKQVAFGLGLLGLLAMPLLAGRQAEINLEEGDTAHDRVVLWREGLLAVRSSDIVFGAGHGTYADIAGLVAHNSFVHAFVELGLVGGTFFFGMFFFAALGFWRLHSPEYVIAHPRQARYLPFMAAIGAGWTIGLMSLSRPYTVSTLMILGLGTAYLNLAGWNLAPRRLVVQWDRPHVRKLVLASLSLFVAFNVFVQVVT
jgi:O-antigen ligase